MRGGKFLTNRLPPNTFPSGRPLLTRLLPSPPISRHQTMSIREHHERYRLTSNSRSCRRQICAWEGAGKRNWEMPSVESLADGHWHVGHNSHSPLPPPPPTVAPVRRHQHRLRDSDGAPSSTARLLASLRLGAATSQALIRPRKSVQAHANNLPYPFFPAGGSSTLGPAVTR